ncbi:MAG TPA: M28 family peptidase [Bryobacteraceae bacterium]|nr:M28 family peptidase [Bryobacteraceae bacterium]
MKRTIFLLALAALAGVFTAPAEYKGINPQVAKVVSEISEDHITATLKKLESFGTRNIYSKTDDPVRGVGAARNWILAEFKSYSPRLDVSFDQYRLKKDTARGSRIAEDVDLYNVVAVLPGTTNPEERIVISGHYDTINLQRAPGAPPNAPGDNPSTDGGGRQGARDGGGREGGGTEGGGRGPGTPPPPRDPNIDAPGVTDDGSGTACVMELARVLSQYQFEKTLVFVAFAGEEEGLLGSTLYAKKAKDTGMKIEAVLNNDIIGSDIAGDGRTDNRRLNVFSEDPQDSPSRELARYIREIGQRYVPEMVVDPVFRADRFGRGGDHTPFNLEGFAAVRFSTPSENFANQHSKTDTFANTSPGYVAHVTRVNGAVAASLALAPNTPATTEQTERNGRKITSLLLTRGRSRYDAQVRWKDEHPAPDLAGYVVLMRPTTSPYWEREIFVGNVKEFVLPGVSIDDVVFGIKAIDKDGNESLPAAYVQNPREKRSISVY